MKDQEKNMENIQAWQQQMLQQHGWYVHGVTDEPNVPNNVNYHTHGLREHFDHPDLQLCLPLAPSDALAFLDIVVATIKNGQRFEPEKDYAGVLPNGYQLRFIAAQESGRKVLRLLVPDAGGGYTEEPYRKQLEQPYDGVPLLPLYYETGDISDTGDIRIFFRGLIHDYGLNFHPDDRFEDYIHFDTQQPVFSAKEASHLNKLMERCFAVCPPTEDIYKIGLAIHNQQRKIPPLPQKGKGRGR